LWAGEVDQKNANAVSTDDLDDDAVYYVNSDLQSNIDDLAGLLESDSDTKFSGLLSDVLSDKTCLVLNCNVSVVLSCCFDLLMDMR